MKRRPSLPWPLLVSVAALVWMAGWATAVRVAAGPLVVDEWAGRPLVSLPLQWQHASAWLLDHETPGHMAVAAAVLAVVAAGLGAWRTAGAVIVGVGAEIATLQWVVKPLVDRHEIAPGLAFPSTYVGAVCALAASTLLLCRPDGPVGGRLPHRDAVRLAVTATVLVTADAAAVSTATIVTGGHLFSDVVAAIPWGLAFPVVAYELAGPIVTRWSSGAL